MIRIENLKNNLFMTVTMAIGYHKINIVIYIYFVYG